MKRVSFVLVCFLICSAAVFSQVTRPTRPRVVPSPTIPDDSSNQPRQAPVLIGRTNDQTPINTENQKIEEDDEIIRIETNLVTFPVSVLDRDGRFISGLQQRDFQVFENGVQQQIEYFQSVEQPFSVVLMIDVSPSTSYRIEEIQEAAIAFTNQLRPADRVMVISFDERVHVLSPLTNNRNVLRNAIRQANFGDGTSLYDAVDYTINQQIRQMKGRKAIVIFTDGVDTTSRRATFQSTVKQSEELDALIYPVRFNTAPYMQGRSAGNVGNVIGIIFGGGNSRTGGGRGAGSSSQEYETGKRYLEELARKSGGRKFEAELTNNLNNAFAGIAEELRWQYSIGYYPEKAGQKGEKRQIRVRVMRPNLVVRAKTSYVFGG